MEQTGWHVTIMAGGPIPDNDGKIMTYLLANLTIAWYLLKLTKEHLDHTQGRRKTERNLISSSVPRNMTKGCWILRSFFMRHSVSYESIYRLVHIPCISSENFKMVFLQRWFFHTVTWFVICHFFVTNVTVLFNFIFSKSYTLPINTTDADNIMNDNTVLNHTIY